MWWSLIWSSKGLTAILTAILDKCHLKTNLNYQNWYCFSTTKYKEIDTPPELVQPRSPQKNNVKHNWVRNIFSIFAKQDLKDIWLFKLTLIKTKQKIYQCKGNFLLYKLCYQCFQQSITGNELFHKIVENEAWINLKYKL